MIYKAAIHNRYQSLVTVLLVSHVGIESRLEIENK